MKRTEMIEKIMEILVKDSPSSYADKTPYQVKLDAIWILNTVESAGMVPPTTSRSFEIYPNAEIVRSVREWDKE